MAPRAGCELETHWVNSRVPIGSHADPKEPAPVARVPWRGPAGGGRYPPDLVGGSRSRRARSTIQTDRAPPRGLRPRNATMPPLTEISNPPEPNGPTTPPGWGPDWESRYPEGTRRGIEPRWFDPNGGEWRWHDPDRFHSEGHWDYNPHDWWNSPWRNIPVPPPTEPFVR